MTAHKKTITALQHKIEELVQANKLLSTELQEDKKTAMHHMHKLEQQISEQTSYNLKLQNEMTKLTAEYNSLQQLEAAKLGNATDRLKALEGELASLREENRLLDNRKTEVHNQLMQSEAKMMKMQAEFQQLKKQSLLIAEKAEAEHKKYSKHIESLHENIQQYRSQIASLQKVNKTLQSQREVLNQTKVTMSARSGLSRNDPWKTPQSSVIPEPGSTVTAAEPLTEGYEVTISPGDLEPVFTTTLSSHSSVNVTALNSTIRQLASSLSDDM